MKKQAVCEFCGKTFENIDENGVYVDFESNCAVHEISHLGLEDEFKSNLKKALALLDGKYESISVVSGLSILVSIDDSWEESIIYNFSIKNNRIDKELKSQIKVSYKNKKQIPIVEYIAKLIENNFFIPILNKKFEGIFKFEDYCGGGGADDYKIGDSYMRTIYESFRNRKVRIETID